MADRIGSRPVCELPGWAAPIDDKFNILALQLIGAVRVFAQFWGCSEFMKILVVEDEPLIRLGLATVIEEAGYEVLEAANAGDAIKSLEADRNIRLVLTDVDMPGGMDGIRLAHYVRDRWPPIQLIVISGKVGVQAGQLPTGAKFVGKPYHEPALLNMVHSLIADGGRST